MTSRCRAASYCAVLLLPAFISCSADIGDPVQEGEKQVEPVNFSIAGHRYSTSRLRQFKLPPELREISGITLDAADRLFALADEIGIIWELDYHQGRVVNRFALEGGVRADFEGIAATPEHLYMITSTGTLFETVPGSNDSLVPFTRYPAQLDCEIEGLSWIPEQAALLAACKNFKKKKKKTAFKAYRWPLARKRFEPSDYLRFKRSDVEVIEPDIGKIQPSGLTRAPNGNLVSIAGRQGLLLELDLEGKPLHVAKLPGTHVHPQTEGIAITSDHVLLLADEGDGKGKRNREGRLSVYQPAD